MEQYRPIPALEKAFAILDLFAANPETHFGVTDIAKATGYNKGTLFYILKSLQLRDFVYQCPYDGKYALGHGLSKYMDAYYYRIANLSGFVEISKKISSECHECINLSVLKGMYNYVVQSVPAQDISLRVDLPVGSQIPSIASSAGKVLLSPLGDNEIRKIYEALSKKYTDKTICSEENFLREIQDVRAQGYAINRGEFEVEVCSVAAPVHNEAGQIIAAINIVLPGSRFTDEAQEKLIRLVKNGAAELSEFSSHKNCPR